VPPGNARVLNRRSVATDTDQYDVGEVDDDDGCCDKQLTTLKVMFIENHG